MSITVTVSQLNAYTASIFRGDKNFRNIIVKGEISNFVNYRKTGHFYFTLKEGGCAVKAVMFSRYASALPFMPEDGMSVYVTANVEVFERDGVYQLYVSDMLPDGVGALYLAAEQLKNKLAAEGIFAEEHKKPIPKYPARIGIVTSREAAALRDMLNIIGRRYPAAEVVLFPCMVQGKDAPESICDALDFADISGCDVIICGRGGGSFEDLNAFNSEEVARTIYNCNTPIISAVGHETDTTIADHAADMRAPTPSAAAELAVPLMSELLSDLEMLSKDLRAAFERYTDDLEMQLDGAQKRLELLSPENRIKFFEEKISDCEKRLEAAIDMRFGAENDKLAHLAAQLDALSPLKIMARGYSAVFKDDSLISSAKSVKAGDKVCIRFSDGERNAVIE
ncbi:MAG: exodeoxyribonuclease VII large subunit [Oscillospiraceae bacterium]